MGGLAIACAQAWQFMQELGIDPAEAEMGDLLNGTMKNGGLMAIHSTQDDMFLCFHNEKW